MINMTAAGPTNIYSIAMRAGTAQSVQRLDTGWTVRGSNPGGDEIFRARPDRPWGPPSLPIQRVPCPFPGATRRGVYHPSPARAEVKEKVELHFYSHCGSSWPVIEWTLLYLYLFNHVLLKIRYIIPLKSAITKLHTKTWKSVKTIMITHVSRVRTHLDMFHLQLSIKFKLLR